MATHGTTGAFEPSNETWLSYAERLEQYFIANDVDAADKKRATLLSVCGATTYQLIRNLVAPAKPTGKSFDELVKDHHQPPPSVTVQRYEFNKRIRRDGESFADFVAHLRQLSEHCQFGDSLNDMMRDRLICGCNSDRLRHQLLAKSPPPKFEEVLALAQLKPSSQRNGTLRTCSHRRHQPQSTLSRKVEETTTLALTAMAVGENTRTTTADSRPLLVTSARNRTHRKGV